MPYNSKVLLDLWAEQNAAEEYKLAMFLNTSRRGDLLVQKLMRVLDNFLGEVQLSPTRYLAYGWVVQLKATMVPACDPAESTWTGGVVLGATIGFDDVDRFQDLREDLKVAGSTLTAPSKRNAFVISNAVHGEQKDGLLCYGDSFSLRLQATPLYLEVEVPTPSSDTGLCNLPVAKLAPTRTYTARFKVQHRCKDMRFETDGMPVMAFEPVVVIQAASNRPLCVETSHWALSYFGKEEEITRQVKLIERPLAVEGTSISQSGSVSFKSGVMAACRYNSNVLVGHWFNDSSTYQQLLDKFVRDKQNNQLKIQKTSALYLKLTQPVRLAVSPEYIAFGSTIQIIAPDVLQNQPLALCFNIRQHNLDRVSGPTREDPVHVSPVTSPCVRNTWRVVRYHVGAGEQSEPLRYGDSVCLAATCDNDVFYIQLQTPHPRGVSRHATPILGTQPCANARFVVVHQEPHLRYETTGQVVPPFTRLVLLHGPSAQALAVDDTLLFHTYYGTEYNVTARTRLNRTKNKHSYHNIWCFNTEIPA